ncbi:hypothetical protein JOF44_003031 [Brachybacterium fresconis]|uniref:Uncharacterized protein n=1 Tax=Brachybacterium fresconis TaxID=173363 RepID=A0ABS4YQC1_9MICO|nr:hypothetical protein [Brachybacterium fresconis]
MAVSVLSVASRTLEHRKYLTLPEGRRSASSLE